jgi:magnesium-transporting ATPase (P-type)
LTAFGSSRERLTAARCCTANITADGVSGDPTEVALVELANSALVPTSANQSWVTLFRFDPRVRLMTSIDADPATSIRWVDTKGAPEAVLPICTDVATGPDETRPLTPGDRQSVGLIAEGFAARGLRVLGVAGSFQSSPRSSEDRASVS